MAYFLKRQTARGKRPVFFKRSNGNKGAIVGTATYTPTGTTDPIAAGSHGVLLWPLPKYYLDSALTQPLDDWPAIPSQSMLRSPKHILTQGDNIYIRATGPPGLGNTAVNVTVTSASDTTGISIPLAEVSPGVYEDQSPALPLQLGTTTGTVSSSGTTTAYTIKVMNKEILKFNFHFNAVNFTGSDVMGLRGKFANCAINDFGTDATTAETQAVTNTKFFNAGNITYAADILQTGNPMKTFIQNAGDGTDGEAVWMQVTSHGVPNGDLVDACALKSYTYTGNGVTVNGNTYTNGAVFSGYSLIISPSQVSSTNWNQNLDWLYLDSCDQLNNPGGGYLAWSSVSLFSNTRPLHGILGACGEVAGTLTTQITTFWSNLNTPNETVLNAYEDAMGGGSSPQPWAVYCNQSNIADTLKLITQDRPGGTLFAYLATTTDVTGGKSLSNTGRPILEVLDNGSCLVRASFPDVSNVRLTPSLVFAAGTDFTKSKHLSFARRIAKSERGDQDFVGKGISETIGHKTSLTSDEAAVVAKTYLTQSFPEFSQRLLLKKVNQQMAGVLSNGKPVTWPGGYLVQFSVVDAGVPIWNNYVNVRIADDRVERVDFQVYNQSRKESSGTVQPLDASTSLAKAIPAIKNALGIQSKYEILSMELVYVNRAVAQGKPVDFSENFIPAWHLLINPSYQNEHARKHLADVWLDSSSGEVIGATGNQ